MKIAKTDSDEIFQLKNTNKGISGNTGIFDAFAELERGVYAALETYSNVHRGSGHYSMVTTHLYEQARDIILEYLGLNKEKYAVIFCTPRRAEMLKAQLEPKSYQSVSSDDIGLSIGLRALAVKRNALPGGAPSQSGGGTAKLISRNWVIWADAPDKFEAGTPAIINVIAFARALRMMRKYGKDIFMGAATERLKAGEILYNDELVQYSGRELLEELRKTLIGRDILVPTAEGNQPFVNLDNSASTPAFTPIWNTFRQAWRQKGQVQQEIVNEVRFVCADVLGASPDTYDVIFTSNTTEAINLAAGSLSREPENGTEPVVLNTILEHSSNDLPWRILPRYSLIRLQVDADGFVDLKELEKLLSSYNEEGLYGNKRIKIVAVSGASNVLGICNNIEEISRIAHRFGARILVDAAQLVAHHKVNTEWWGVDYLTFSAHKVYAPFGCGVLMVRKGLLKFSPPEMELIRSSGEENTGGIAALGKALVLLNRIGMDLIQEEEQVLTGRLLRGMAQINGLRAYGVQDLELPRFAHKIGVIVFSLKSMMPDRLAKELAIRGGIGVRYGCHCSHIIIKHLLHVNPTLEQFQRLIQTLFPKLRLPGLVRVSLGIENSEEDVDKLIQVLRIIRRQDRSAPNGKVSPGEKHILPRAEVQQQMKDFTEAASLKVYSYF